MSCLHILATEQKVEQDSYSYVPVTANKECQPVLGFLKVSLQITRLRSTKIQSQVCLNLAPEPASFECPSIISPLLCGALSTAAFAHIVLDGVTCQCQLVLPAFLSTPEPFLGFLPAGEQRRQHGAEGASLSSPVLGTKWLGF